jgi:sugar phosphate isomerase/epimerase
MNHLSIGIRLESFALPFRDALAAAARLGVHGVQFDALGELSPDRLSQTGVRELRNLLRSYDLELTALGCPMRRGLDVPDDQQRRIEHVESALTRSYELGARIVIVEAGRVPDAPPAGVSLPEADELRLRCLQDSLAALARHGDRIGATLALETGAEAPERLRQFLDGFDTASLAVNFEPANLFMNGYDPALAARTFRDKLAHASARDVRRAGPSRTAQEIPLGHGDIDWLALLSAFEEIEYRRWLLIKRETEVAAAVGFLRRLGVA